MVDYMKVRFKSYLFLHKDNIISYNSITLRKKPRCIMKMFNFHTLSIFCRYFCTFTWVTSECNGVFWDYGISTFTAVTFRSILRLWYFNFWIETYFYTLLFLLFQFRVFLNCCISTFTEVAFWKQKYIWTVGTSIITKVTKYIWAEVFLLSLQ